MFGFRRTAEAAAMRAAKQTIEQRVPEIIREYLDSPECAAQLRRIQDEVYAEACAKYADDPAALATIRANYARMTGAAEPLRTETQAGEGRSEAEVRTNNKAPAVSARGGGE
jgi:hypothetical protein